MNLNYDERALYMLNSVYDITELQRIIEGDSVIPRKKCFNSEIGKIWFQLIAYNLFGI